MSDRIWHIVLAVMATGAWLLLGSLILFILMLRYIGPCPKGEAPVWIPFTFVVAWLLFGAGSLYWALKPARK